MLGAISLIAQLGGFVPAAACDPKLDVSVSTYYQPPVIRSTYTSSEIRSLSIRIGTPLRHGALGFFMARVGYEVDVAFGGSSESVCGTLVAKVHLVLGPHLIEIARDLEVLGCRRDLVVLHFVRHTELDDRTIGDYSARTQTALAAQLQDHLRGAANLNEVREAAVAAIRRAMDRVKQSIDADLENGMAAVDSEEELQRLFSGCTHAL